MAAEVESSNGVAGTGPSEHTPLLRDNRDEGTTEAQDEEVVTDEDTPVAKEPSAKELIFILGSIWLGVFLAALGTRPLITHHPVLSVDSADD